jgi:hypothetical protein
LMEIHNSQEEIRRTIVRRNYFDARSGAVNTDVT